jgi:hypothetical protein
MAEMKEAEEEATSSKQAGPLMRLRMMVEQEELGTEDHNRRPALDTPEKSSGPVSTQTSPRDSLGNL